MTMTMTMIVRLYRISSFEISKIYFSRHNFYVLVGDSEEVSGEDASEDSDDDASENSDEDSSVEEPTNGNEDASTEGPAKKLKPNED